MRHADDANWEVVATRQDDLLIPFASPTDAAAQLERWAGGWTQFLEGLDALGQGEEARRRLREHLTGFASPTDDGIELAVRYHASMLRPRR